MNIISLGAGVQSSTMALMAAHGEITPMPDCAIFADTQSEPKAVYTWLDWLETKLPFPVYRVTAGNLGANALKNLTLSGHKFQDIPWRTAEGGLGRRQCTTQYKLIPLYRKLRELGATSKSPASVWVGISVDEAHRAKPTRVKYAQNIFPLLNMNFYRLDCLTWMQERGYPKPAKSACVFCPYHANDEWREVKKSPDDWATAIAVDRAIRDAGVMQYAHRDLVPLDVANLAASSQVDLWGNECEGMCGV